mmetsp:Transcript_39424/g.92083  ORF Transcript_39424/g.92083 Transcript_39424/m.92083 type:complete len:303 (+) Transcript_39424:2141-3049(+)
MTDITNSGSALGISVTGHCPSICSYSSGAGPRSRAIASFGDRAFSSSTTADILFAGVPVFFAIITLLPRSLDQILHVILSGGTIVALGATVASAGAAVAVGVPIDKIGQTLQQIFHDSFVFGVQVFCSNARTIILSCTCRLGIAAFSSGAGQITHEVSGGAFDADAAFSEGADAAVAVGASGAAVSLRAAAVLSRASVADSFSAIAAAGGAAASPGFFRAAASSGFFGSATFPVFFGSATFRGFFGSAIFLGFFGSTTFLGLFSAAVSPGVFEALGQVLQKVLHNLLLGTWRTLAFPLRSGA